MFKIDFVIYYTFIMKVAFYRCVPLMSNVFSSVYKNTKD